eukprot:TRINITY_DN5132_c0_g1_i3.p1 TRINITY_DN5132_c0_g1~~TRINITY_DN5132_c0_g1_i3.p1  ORF type:complete len:575 (-),score=58.64 TRINITY_DN5132_c0_g1_i3:289-2013(-)
MIRRPPRSTLSSSSAASDVYKRQYQRRVRGISCCSMALSPRSHHASLAADTPGRSGLAPLSGLTFHEVQKAFLDRTRQANGDTFDSLARMIPGPGFAKSEPASLKMPPPMEKKDVIATSSWHNRVGDADLVGYVTHGLPPIPVKEPLQHVPLKVGAPNPKPRLGESEPAPLMTAKTKDEDRVAAVPNRQRNRRKSWQMTTEQMPIDGDVPSASSGQNPPKPRPSPAAVIWTAGAAAAPAPTRQRNRRKSWQMTNEQMPTDPDAPVASQCSSEREPSKPRPSPAVIRTAEAAAAAPAPTRQRNRRKSWQMTTNQIPTDDVSGSSLTSSGPEPHKPYSSAWANATSEGGAPQVITAEAVATIAPAPTRPRNRRKSWQMTNEQMPSLPTDNEIGGGSEQAAHPPSATKPRPWFVCSACGQMLRTPMKLRRHEQACTQELRGRFSAKQLRLWGEVFDQLDLRERGVLDREAIEGLLMHNPIATRRFKASEQEVSEAFEAMDLDRDGAISFPGPRQPMIGQSSVMVGSLSAMVRPLSVMVAHSVPDRPVRSLRVLWQSSVYSCPSHLIDTTKPPSDCSE